MPRIYSGLPGKEKDTTTLLCASIFANVPNNPKSRFSLGPWANGCQPPGLGFWLQLKSQMSILSLVLMVVLTKELADM